LIPFLINSLFVRVLLRAGVWPTLNPSTETVERSNALAQERGGELVGVCECVRDVQGGKVK